MLAVLLDGYLMSDWSTPHGMVLVQAMTVLSPMLPVEWAKA